MSDVKDKPTGRTTAQMLAAPVGALYIWPEARSLNYARALARHLGRTDLRIESVGFLDARGWIGLPVDQKAVIDHAVRPEGLSAPGLDGLSYLRDQLCNRGSPLDPVQDEPLPTPRLQTSITYRLPGLSVVYHGEPASRMTWLIRTLPGAWGFTRLWCHCVMALLSVRLWPTPKRIQAAAALAFTRILEKDQTHDGV
jgi:hypothetical protein